MSKQWFTVEQLSLDVYALAEFAHWEKVVSYLIIDRRQAYLFDTGMGYAPITPVVQALTDLPVRVYLTHGHWDHIGGVEAFSAVAGFDHDFERDQVASGFDSATIDELMEPRYFEDGFAPRHYRARGNAHYEALSHGMQVESDSFVIEVIHTPGHTPGSVCYHIPQKNLLITGDTLYPGPLYAQLPESSLQDYAKSIAQLQTLVHPELILLPGHNASQVSSGLIGQASALFADLVKIPEDALPEKIEGNNLSILLR